MAVTGFVEVARMVRNSTMRPGDRLFLTKPLGTGIIATAVKNGLATPEQLASAVETMTTLNAGASEAMLEARASAATDVTGFGLLGHLQIALAGSGASASVNAHAIRLLNGTFDLAMKGVIPSGTYSNHEFVGPNVDWGELPEVEQLVLADAQTSGGLLIAIPDERADALREALAARGIPAAEIGVVGSDRPGSIRVLGRVATD
jgi:selenide,water dikinase